MRTCADVGGGDLDAPPHNPQSSRVHGVNRPSLECAVLRCSAILAAHTVSRRHTCPCVNVFSNPARSENSCRLCQSRSRRSAFGSLSFIGSQALLSKPGGDPFSRRIRRKRCIRKLTDRHPADVATLLRRRGLGRNEVLFVVPNYLQELHKRGLTLRGFASMCGVSRTHITKVFRGSESPSPKLERKMREVLGKCQWCNGKGHFDPLP